MTRHLVTVGRELTRGLLQLLYPNLCEACGQVVPPAQGVFCAACRQAVTADPHSTCPRCASTVGAFTYLEGGCSRCRGSHYHFDSALRLGPYEGLLRDLILRLKQWSGENLAEHLGSLWAEHAESRLRAIGADVIIPIPLHWRRKWQRGYNQSAVLARPLAVRLQLPCRTGWLRRVQHTARQTEQSPSARARTCAAPFGPGPLRTCADERSSSWMMS